MRNLIYFFIGSDLEQCALAVKKEMRKQATQDVDSCLHVLSWGRKDEQEVISQVRFTPYDAGEFRSEILDGAFDFEIVQDIPLKEDNSLRNVLNALVQDVNTIGGVGADLDTHFNIVLPVNDKECVENACRVIKVLGGIAHVFSDAILLNNDVMVAMGVKDENNHEEIVTATKFHIEQLMKLKDDEGLLKKIILIQNTNANGAALNLNADNLPIILSTLGELEIQGYDSVFPPALDTNPGELTSLGISSLVFDRNYAAQYLLRRAYLELMKNEKVDQDNVDANRVSIISQNALTAYQNMFSRFFQGQIQPQLDGNTSTEQILNNSGQAMQDYLTQAKDAITSFIADPTLSLPEKRGVLSKMLMLDNVSIEGVQFDGNALTFLDYYTETMEYFIKLNNGVMFELDDNNRPKVDQYGKKIMRQDVVKSSLNEKGEVYLPIKRLKNLRLSIHQDAQDLRQCKEDIKRIENQLQADLQSDVVIAQGEDVLIKNGYRLIGDKIQENPLAEDYEPENITTIPAVQLQREFTPIKDQGKIGSCSAFAVVSVIEFILKKTSTGNPDLSERFVYYNVRESQGEIGEEGSAVSDIIASISQKGVCRENDCPYINERMNDKPSPVAYEHAQECKIANAKNIIIGNDNQKNLDLMRTAVAEGYPVIFSLRLSESFGRTKGYVQTPDESELMSADEKHGRHAMVICGYDDNTECFLVRNSWGKHFGKNGYCYIPYDYVCDNKFTTCAYIITALSSVDNQHVVGIKDDYKVDFNQMDSVIRIAIKHKNIRRLEKSIKEKTQEYQDVKREFEELKNDLCNRNLRNNIVSLSKERADYLIRDKKYNIDLLRANMQEELTNLESTNSLWMTALWILAALFLLIYVGLGFSDSTNLKNFFPLPIISLASLFAAYSIYKNRKKKYDRKKEEFENKIAAESQQIGLLQQRKEDLDIRSYFAGEFLSKIQGIEMDLINLHSTTNAYTNNLKVWYDEEREKIEIMDIKSSVPNNFVSVYTNEDLDNIFTNQAQQWLDGLNLWNYLRGNFGVGQAGLINFKNILKHNLLNRLRMVLQPISLSNNLMGLANNNLLEGQNVVDVLNICSNLSQPFVNITNRVSSSFIVFLHGGDMGNNGWQNMVRPAFALPPTCCSIDRDDVLMVAQVCDVKVDNISI